MCKCQCGGSQEGGTRTKMGKQKQWQLECAHGNTALLQCQPTPAAHLNPTRWSTWSWGNRGTTEAREKKMSFAKLLVSPPLFISTKHSIYMKLVKQMNKEEYAEEQGFLKYSERCTLVYDFFGYDSISFHQDQSYIKKHQFIKDTAPLKTIVILWRCSITLWNGVFVKVKGSLIPDQAKFRDILNTFQKMQQLRGTYRLLFPHPREKLTTRGVQNSTWVLASKSSHEGAELVQKKRQETERILSSYRLICSWKHTVLLMIQELQASMCHFAILSPRNSD